MNIAILYYIFWISQLKDILSKYSRRNIDQDQKQDFEAMSLYSVYWEILSLRRSLQNGGHAVPTKFDISTTHCLMSHSQWQELCGFSSSLSSTYLPLNYSVALTLRNTGRRTVTYYVPFPKDTHSLSLLPSASSCYLFLGSLFMLSVLLHSGLHK